MSSIDRADEIISIVSQAILIGESIQSIHDALIYKGWSEADAFLFIKAGQILCNDHKQFLINYRKRI
jgi:hypothetical protein